MHLHRQASYQSQFPCLPTSTRFGGVKSTEQLITCPIDLKITKLLSSREGCVCLMTVSTYTQLTPLTYWDDHTATNPLALRRQISRFISCSLGVIAYCATWGWPLLPSTPSSDELSSIELPSAFDQLATLVFTGRVLKAPLVV